jgi:hypothetical protein
LAALKSPIFSLVTRVASLNYPSLGLATLVADQKCL